MPYDRKAAVEYAREYAGCTDSYTCSADADATAFVSRCIAVGLGAAAGAVELSDIARPCELADILPGDVVQIRTRKAAPYKSLIVTENSDDDVLVAAHSYISCDRPLKSYRIHEIRCLKIDG